MADGEILIGSDEHGPATLRLDRANRHGLIAGATGTGKTVTLQVLAEAFAAAGTPVFAADVKGDLSGIAATATVTDKLTARATATGAVLTPTAAPAIFWDLFAAKGHPVRCTVSEMGPLLLSRLFELSDAQAGVMTVVFAVCDKEGLLLLDLDDLQAALQHVAENAKTIGQQYGNVAPATVSTIQRKLLELRQAGGDKLFGEPVLKLADLMRRDTRGEGFVSVLAADTLVSSPGLYAVFLLWLMSELFEQLPEVGDPLQPNLVFFFDEAHLLFTDAPKPLLDKVEQVVRLVRSKGVGIWFVTQNPMDVPESVLAQLGNRIMHGLHAYTPSEQAAVKAASQSFRPSKDFDTADAIQNLGVGEALVSVLDEKGAPTPVRRVKIRPPNSRMGPITPEERARIMAASPVAGVYDTPVNRESAYEKLAARTEATVAGGADEAKAPVAHGGGAVASGAMAGAAAVAGAIGVQVFRNVLSAAGSTAGREIISSVAGGVLGKGMGRTVGRNMGAAAGRTLTREVGTALLRGILGGLSRR